MLGDHLFLSHLLAFTTSSAQHPWRHPKEISSIFNLPSIRVCLFVYLSKISLRFSASFLSPVNYYFAIDWLLN